MHLRILKAVAYIRVVGIEDYQSPFMEDAVTVRRAPVVLMDFRKPRREIVQDMVNLMIKGHLHQLGVGKDLPDLAPEVLVHTVVVISPQEASGYEIVPQPGRFLIREPDLPMSCHINKWKGKKVLIHDGQPRLFPRSLDSQYALDFTVKIRKRRRIAIPVPTTPVLEPGYPEFPGRARAYRGGAENQRQGKKQ